jgi:hypothetical protein
MVRSGSAVVGVGGGAIAVVGAEELVLLVVPLAVRLVVARFANAFPPSVLMPQCVRAAWLPWLRLDAVG